MKIITFAALAILGGISTSTAFAGCGRPSPTNILPMTAAEKAAARQFGSTLAEGPSRAGDIVGLWISTISSGGQDIYQAFESFTKDGLEILNDNGSTLNGNVCLGVWTATGRNKLKVYHPSWNYDNSGNLIGTVIIKEEITLDASGDTFTGTVTVDVLDLNNKPVQPTLQATLTGKRITAD